MKRNIIKIDEEKCVGCGLCTKGCAEGALQIVDGKAKLANENFCDGLGKCIAKCPFGALTIEEREAEIFDQNHKKPAATPAGGCPGMKVMKFDEAPDSRLSEQEGSALRQWPIQLTLVSPQAPYFENADLLVAADCCAFSYANFHKRFLAGKAMVQFCPKLDQDLEAYVEKLAIILRANEIKSITVAKMEVPCCMGTLKIVEEAVKKSGKVIPIKEYTISIRGGQIV